MVNFYGKMRQSAHSPLDHGQAASLRWAMTQKDTDKQSSAPKGRSQQKAEALSAALRANLAKRKQQARGRQDEPTNNTSTPPTQERD